MAFRSMVPFIPSKRVFCVLAVGIFLVARTIAAHGQDVLMTSSFVPSPIPSLDTDGSRISIADVDGNKEQSVEHGTRVVLTNFAALRSGTVTHFMQIRQTFETQLALQRMGQKSKATPTAAPLHPSGVPLATLYDFGKSVARVDEGSSSVESTADASLAFITPEPGVGAMLLGMGAVSAYVLRRRRRRSRIGLMDPAENGAPLPGARSENDSPA